MLIFLTLSQGLQNTGAVDWLARSVLARNAGRLTGMLALMGLGAALSGFMKIVGAMALLMPIAVPLGARVLRIPDARMAIIVGAIMLGAVGIVALGLLPAAMAFALGVLASMVARTVPLRQVHTAIDWPVVVLLAALIPVAGGFRFGDYWRLGLPLEALVIAVSVPLPLVVWPL